MIVYEDEEYLLWDAHTHFSNLVSKPFKFLLKSLSIKEIMDFVFASWTEAKKDSKNRLERNINLYKLVLDYYNIDKAIQLPVFKLDRKFSYRMNEMFQERIFGFGYIAPRAKSLEEDLQEIVEKKVLGIKIHPSFGKFTFKACQDELTNIFQFCAENKIIVLSHTGSHSEIKNLVPILKKCDETRFIIAHSGLCPQVNDAIQVAKNYSNIYLEMSGNPYTYKFMEAIKSSDIGVERVLFGTDLPSLNPRVEIEKVLALDISVDERRLIFSGNLQKLMKNTKLKV